MSRQRTGSLCPYRDKKNCSGERDMWSVSMTQSDIQSEVCVMYLQCVCVEDLDGAVQQRDGQQSVVRRKLHTQDVFLQLQRACVLHRQAPASNAHTRAHNWNMSYIIRIWDHSRWNTGQCLTSGHFLCPLSAQTPRTWPSCLHFLWQYLSAIKDTHDTVREKRTKTSDRCDRKSGFTWSGARHRDHRAPSWASTVSRRVPDASSKICSFPLWQGKTKQNTGFD